MALLDVLDEAGIPTGDTKTKAEIHEQGLWHRSSHVWVYDSTGNILLQLRAKNKDSSPGLWDISAAGHVDAGETPEFAAVREVEEEIGLSTTEDNLKKVWERRESTFDPANGWTNNQISCEYILLYDGKHEELVYQEEEIDELRWLTIEELKNEFADPRTFSFYVDHGDGYYERIISEIQKALCR